jgi:spermidine synthase
VALYDDGPFLKALPNALTSNGILVAQVGEAPYMDSPAESLSINKNRANFLRSLGDLGFEAIHTYEEVGTVQLFDIICPLLNPSQLF